MIIKGLTILSRSWLYFITLVSIIYIQSFDRRLKLVEKWHVAYIYEINNYRDYSVARTSKKVFF